MNAKYDLIPLADSVYAFVFPELDDLGNAGIVITEAGVVVIDTDVRSVDRLFELLPKLTDQPVRFLINTHHAFDHSSANCIFAERGVAIIASERCRTEMIAHGQENFGRWTQRKPEIGKMLTERGISIAPPHVTFTDRLSLHLGGRTLEISYVGHAHTPGDIVIHLPEERIVFAGDLLWFGTFPNVREADVPNQIRVIDRLAALNAAVYVPGHGHVSHDIKEVEKLRKFMADLSDRVDKMKAAGKAFEEVKKLEADLVAEYPDWSGRSFLTRAIEVIYHQSR